MNGEGTKIDQTWKVQLLLKYTSYINSFCMKILGDQINKYSIHKPLHCPFQQFPHMIFTWNCKREIFIKLKDPWELMHRTWSKIVVEMCKLLTEVISSSIFSYVFIFGYEDRGILGLSLKRIGFKITANLSCSTQFIITILAIGQVTIVKTLQKVINVEI